MCASHKLIICSCCCAHTPKKTKPCKTGLGLLLYVCLRLCYKVVCLASCFGSYFSSIYLFYKKHPMCWWTSYVKLFWRFEASHLAQGLQSQTLMEFCCRIPCVSLQLSGVIALLPSVRRMTTGVKQMVLAWPLRHSLMAKSSTLAGVSPRKTWSHWDNPSTAGGQRAWSTFTAATQTTATASTLNFLQVLTGPHSHFWPLFARPLYLFCFCFLCKYCKDL